MTYGCLNWCGVIRFTPARVNCLIDIMNMLIEKNDDIEYTSQEKEGKTKLIFLENEIENLYVNSRSNEENIRIKLSKEI